METLFLKLINLSVTAGWMVLAILILRMVLRRAPRWIFCLLWGIVALRLICPLSIESSLSLIPSRETISEDSVYLVNPKIESGVPVIDQVVNPLLSKLPAAVDPELNKPTATMPPGPVQKRPIQLYATLLSRLWLAGMVAMLAYTAVSYCLLKRRFSTATPLCQNIKQGEQVDSPFVLGIFHPVIYLPYHIDGTDFDYVVAHEQAHIRRKDHWWKPLGFLLLSVYWFNPLLWLAYVLLCRDIEAACDENVIREMAEDDRRAYSLALLNCSVHRRRIAACPLAFGETGVKARILSVMNYKKPAFWLISLSLLAAIIASVCLLTVPKPNRVTIEWVQELSAEDVDYIEHRYSTFSAIYRYRLYSDNAIAAIVDLLNNASGESIVPTEYYEADGTALIFTVVMKNGDVHTVKNDGNRYLIVDDHFYAAPYEWLHSWREIPYSDSLAEYYKPLKLFDAYDDPEVSLPVATQEIQLPEFPGVTFEYSTQQIVAVTRRKRTVLATGSPIQSVYFHDMTGDGLRDLCATISHDSEFSDTHAVIINYVTGDDYLFQECGHYDFRFRPRDNMLVYEQWTCSTRELSDCVEPLIRNRPDNGAVRLNKRSILKIPSITISPTNLRGFHDVYLYLPLKGNTYRYESSSLVQETLTAGELLYEFDHWKIYSVSEYPDYSVVLAVTNQGERSVYQHCPSRGLNANALQSAKDIGCVIFEDHVMTYGEQTWQDFMDAVNAGEMASVQIACCYTLDPANCSAEYYELHREDYPTLCINKLSFDGVQYTLEHSDHNSIIHYSPTDDETLSRYGVVSSDIVYADGQP